MVIYKVAAWLPFAHYVVSILIEMEMQSEGVVGRATYAVVTRHSFPRINYSFHKMTV